MPALSHAQTGQRPERSAAVDAPITVETIECDPTRRGYTNIPNYFKYFWAPLLGLKAAATYELLCSFAHGAQTQCYPSVGLLADTLGIDRHDLTGRMRRDSRPGHCPEYYQKGTFQILAEHDLCRVIIEERHGTRHYRFQLRKSPPLLTAEQLAQLPERIQRRHQQLLARCAQEAEVFARPPIVWQSAVEENAATTQSASNQGGDAVTGGCDAATEPGDAATGDLNTTDRTAQREQLSAPEAQRAKQVSEFYRALGQPRISRQKREEGIALLEDLAGQGFSVEDIDWTLEWIVQQQARLGQVYSLRLVPSVIGQALQEREQARQAEEKRRKQREAARQAQVLQQRREAQARRYKALPVAVQEDLCQQARQALVASGIKPALMVNGLVKDEAVRLLGQAEAGNGWSMGAAG